jgi:AraC-like DNA-binding protein/mannose-6-phosphate isomerase-like protein (cupin superfamily)
MFPKVLSFDKEVLSMPVFETVIDTYAGAVNEEVVYQNPLLFLKIWEIYSDAHQFHGVPEIWPWHYHKEVEFLAIVEGRLGIQSKRDYVVLGPGDVLIMGASQLHRSHKDLSNTLRYVVFQVDLVKHFDQITMPYLDCFSELTQPLDELNYIFKEHEAAKIEAYQLILEIHKESQTRMKGYEMAISSAIKRLMLLLLRSDTRNVLKETDETGVYRLRPVLTYVETRLKDKITVEEASALLNVSYHYFIRYFRKIMGISFVDYVNYKRIKASERLLMTSELSILEVGYEVGISNMAQFYKLFRRHNQCSPREFKQRMRA